jgi:hypothetical protein
MKLSLTAKLAILTVALGFGIYFIKQAERKAKAES